MSKIITKQRIKDFFTKKEVEEVKEEQESLEAFYKRNMEDYRDMLKDTLRVAEEKSNSQEEFYLDIIKDRNAQIKFLEEKLSILERKR